MYVLGHNFYNSFKKPVCGGILKVFLKVFDFPARPPTGVTPSVRVPPFTHAPPAGGTPSVLTPLSFFWGHLR